MVYLQYTQEITRSQGKWDVYEIDPTGKLIPFGVFVRDREWKEAYLLCDRGNPGIICEVRSFNNDSIDVRYVKTSDGIKKV